MTTEYLLDTNACIAIRDLLAKKKIKSPDRQQRLARLRHRWLQIPADKLAMSVVTLGELQFGVVKSDRPATSMGRLNALREVVRVISFDVPGHESLVQHYAEIRFILETGGEKIGANDTWIAAHGRALGFTIVTNNHDEFRRVPGLVHEDWMA